MVKDLLAKLRSTKPVTISTAVVRTLDDSTLDAVVGGLMCRSNSASYGTADDCGDAF